MVTEERGIIDVNAIGGDLLGAQFEDVGKGNGKHRAIMARVGYLSLADGGPSLVPGTENPVPAGANRRKKPRGRCSYRFLTDDHRNIAELKPCIRSEQVNEGIRIAGVDNREYMRPPSTIALYCTESYDIETHCCTAYATLRQPTNPTR
jgi:hypothetical protein